MGQSKQHYRKNGTGPSSEPNIVMHRALFAHAIFGFLCTAEGHSDYNAYRVWLAIKYFWGPQGPVVVAILLMMRGHRRR